MNGSWLVHVMKSKAVLNMINIGKILCRIDVMSGFVVDTNGEDLLE